MNKSTDGGRTWGDYREITVKNTPANWTIQHCPSPGIGVQLEKQKDDRLNGRLIVPCNDASLNNGRNEFRAHLIVSDDFGESWRVAALENYLGASESVIVERNDGVLVYNCRNQSGFPSNRRIQSFSYDGGDTLEGSATVDTLFDPLCHAGFAIAEVDGKEYIFLTSPTGELGNATDFFRTGTPQHWGVREALMLYASSDGGQTYKAIKQVCDKGVFAAYSALCVTKSGKLLCAWESGPEIGLYRDIKYTTFDLSELVKLCD
jgi:sialidase-1